MLQFHKKNSCTIFDKKNDKKQNERKFWELTVCINLFLELISNGCSVHCLFYLGLRSFVKELGSSVPLSIMPKVYFEDDHHHLFEIVHWMGDKFMKDPFVVCGSQHSRWKESSSLVLVKAFWIVSRYAANFSPLKSAGDPRVAKHQGVNWKYEFILILVQFLEIFFFRFFLLKQSNKLRVKSWTES